MRLSNMAGVLWLHSVCSTVVLIIDAILHFTHYGSSQIVVITSFLTYFILQLGLSASERYCLAIQ
jgi:hypothetical protein